MKSVMIALAAVASLSAAAPAFAASTADRDRDYYQSRSQEPVQYSGLSEHCKQVLENPYRWGDSEATFCRNSIP